MDAFGWTPEFNKDEQESPLRAIPSDGIIPSHDEPRPSQNTSEPSRPDQDPNQTPAKGVASVRHDNAIAIDHIREHAATKEPSSATSSQRVSFVGVRTSIFKSNRNRAEIVGITVKPLGPNAANDTGNGASSHAFPREEGLLALGEATTAHKLHQNQQLQAHRVYRHRFAGALRKLNGLIV
ncbi:hypothetical protein SeLEV6574_g05231 [Synchytrium endobioticum]|uniref:Uncharacterized protein n=1 Tax=Synchytrium endobioticum TaxID=286115 RepID=A0A507CVI7_9FUNG|nr:hypothetical protein SeLEV6574_g05231 [Synchytrium endobioticum]